MVTSLAAVVRRPGSGIMLHDDTGAGVAPVGASGHGGKSSPLAVLSRASGGENTAPKGCVQHLRIAVWWCGGVVVWWCGGVVLWCCGAVVLWCCGGVVRNRVGFHAVLTCVGVIVV